MQWVARQVLLERPTFCPLPATQLEPDWHWLLAVQTPTPLGQGQSVVQARSRAVLQVGLSTHTASLVAVPALVCVCVDVQRVHGLHMAALSVVEKPLVQAVQTLFVVVLPPCAEKPGLQFAQGWQRF